MRSVWSTVGGWAPCLLLAFAAALVSASCAPIRGEVGHSGGTGEAAIPYRSEGRALSVAIDIEVDAGVVNFSIVAPGSNVKFQSPGFTAGQAYSAELKFDGARGDWRVVFDLLDAELDYTDEWHE